MIAAMVLAAAVGSTQPESLATWDEMAREMADTGEIVCPMTPQEKRVVESMNRWRIRSGDTSQTDVALHSPGLDVVPKGCAVIAVKISALGGVISPRVLRYKGNVPAKLTPYIFIPKFKRRARDWSGIIEFRTSSRRQTDTSAFMLYENREEAVADFKVRAAAAAGAK